MTLKQIYPTLLKSANIIDSNSWFDVRVRKNNKKLKVLKKPKTVNVSYIDTKKIKLELTSEQKTKIDRWLNDCIDIYNITNNYIKNNNLTSKDINFIKIRGLLKEQIKEVCSNNKLNKHVGDYAVKHCVEMYKSAYSNHPNGQFDIRNLEKDRRRKNFVLEPANISKKRNTFCSLGDIKSSLDLNIISKNSILQYDSYKKTFIIITPIDRQKTILGNNKGKCGIDIGVRTFMTTYSENESYEIGTNTNKIIDRMNNKLDRIREAREGKILSEIEYKRLWYKYQDKLNNRINDLHNKSSKFLVKQYSVINIGKVSTKSMISNINGNLGKITKRRLMILSHYRFRMKLKELGKKHNCKIKEIDEYMTSKKCSSCGNIKTNLGYNKVYNCENCNVIIDRDINASINIYNI